MVMKKYHFLAVVAVAALAACSKTAPVAETPDPLDDGSAVAVSFAAYSPKNIDVKSTGAVENAWAGQTLKIYGYDKTVTDFSAATPFINNVEAAAPSSGVKGEITVLNPDYNEPFYYVTGKYYDFYGYHIDDAFTDDPVAQADGVYVPFTIDGSQDLMIAKADQATDIASAGASISADKAYSAYAARRGVQPNLLFHHLLSRFTFNIVAGSETGSKINVDAIKMVSKSSGQLKVVGEDRGLANVSETLDTLALMEKQDGEMVALTPVQPDTYAEARDNAKQVGESLMVIPGESSYKLLVSTSQEGVATEIEPQEYEINIANITGAPDGATAFEAGYSYKVTLVIYGLEEVKFTVELEEWKDGGSTIIDPDLI